MKIWIAKLKNGEIKTENDSKWNEIKDQIIELSFTINGQIINLPSNMEKYYQAKTASVGMNGGKILIESRYLGWKSGSNIIKVRIDEKTNNIQIEIEKCPE